MINLLMSFQSPLSLLVFLLLAVAGGYWTFIRLKKRLSVNFTPVIVFNVALFVFWVITGRLYHDEAVHVHLSWLISKGLIPYRDFWFHHSPFLWVILAPVVSLFDKRPEIFLISRLFACLVIAVNAFLGWKIAKRVWQKNADHSVFLLLLTSVFVCAQFKLLRPDIFMTFFLLAGIYISLDIPGKKIYPSFLAGLSFAIAASFLVKQYLVYFVPVIAVFLGEKRRLLKLAAYALGFATGILPLASYLINMNIIREFISWVFIFNKSIVVVSIAFPFVIALFACWGAKILFQKYRNSHDEKQLILLCALFLSTASSLTTTKYATGGYYLYFWFFICAVTASGCDISRASEKMPSLIKRAVAVGVLFGALLVPNIDDALLSGRNTFFRDKKVVTELMKYCHDQSCVAVVPLHPIFARDATRFFTYSQYLFSEDSGSVRDDIVKNDMAARIKKMQPAVVVCRYLKKDFMLDLFQKGLISAQDYRELLLFFKENYTRKIIGQEAYYIRNDRLR